MTPRVAIAEPAIAVEHAFPSNDRFARRAEPEKRHVKYFHNPEAGEQGTTWKVVTEWWIADSLEAEGGDPDINFDGEPTGYTVTQSYLRCEDGAVFYPLIQLDQDGPSSPDCPSSEC